MRRTILLTSLILLVAGCQKPDQPTPEPTPETQTQWSELPSIDLDEINADLSPDKPTMDLGVYLPSNFDPSFKKVSLENILTGIQGAKDIYARVGVQVNLLWIKTGEVDPRHFSIPSSHGSGLPTTDYVDMYEHYRRHPTTPSDQALAAFEAIVEPHPDNNRTLYLVALQDVFMPYTEFSKGRSWVVNWIRTKGLSFPGYIHGDQMPNRFRGVFTITSLESADGARRTIAHEIGHKAINVSHEYKDIDPQHEVYEGAGLMIYDNGDDIPSGEEGRWHVERLLLSPFIYTTDDSGRKKWNPDYEEGGHYRDPIYGSYMVGSASP